MTDKTTISLRLPTDLLEAIDRRAAEVSISRNAWIEKCTRWAIHNLPRPEDGKDRDKKIAFAKSAPADVAGYYSEDMGLDQPG